MEEKPLPPKIAIAGLNAWYDNVHALREVSLDIQPKCVTALIGPSGCGKSTCLRWINRMNDVIPTARARGKVQLDDGLDILAASTDVVLLRRRIGIVFPKPNPFPKTIFDNVAFGPRLHFRLSRSELENLVIWSLEKVGLFQELKDRLRNNALELTNGQQQRLCLARAIAVGPEVLLMDEPCSALDPMSTAQMEDHIYELRSDYTIVMVTHNMQQASRLSDNAAFFLEGEIVEEGVTNDLFTRPRQQQTEDYVSGKLG